MEVFRASLYRVIQEEPAILWEMIVCVILSKIGYCLLKWHNKLGGRDYSFYRHKCGGFLGLRYTG